MRTVSEEKTVREFLEYLADYCGRPEVVMAQRSAAGARLNFGNAPTLGDLTIGNYVNLVQVLDPAVEKLRDAFRKCGKQLVDDEMFFVRDLLDDPLLPRLQCPSSLRGLTINFLLASLRQTVVTSGEPSRSTLDMFDESRWSTDTHLAKFRVARFDELTLYKMRVLVLELTSIYEILVEILRECWSLLSEEERRDLQEFLPALRR